MKEKFKQINWGKIGWRSFQAFSVLILNTPLWVYLIGSMVPYAEFGEFKLSWIDYLRLSDKVEFYNIWALYLCIPIGVMLSVFWIKYLYEKNKKEKQHQEQLKAQEKHSQIVAQAIKESKEQKTVDKYLGD